MPLGDLCSQLGRLLSLGHKSLLFHQHLDALLLVDHFLLVIHNFHAFLADVHLVELVSYNGCLAHDRHFDLGGVGLWLASDWVNLVGAE